MSVLRVVLIARGRLRQGGEAGFRAEGVALIYVVKSPDSPLVLMGALAECGDQNPRASAVRPSSPAETGRREGASAG